MGLQLVLEAELLSAAVTFIRLLSGVDALVTLQRAFVTEAAPTELALERVVTCHAEKQQLSLSPECIFLIKGSGFFILECL